MKKLIISIMSILMLCSCGSNNYSFVYEWLKRDYPTHNMENYVVHETKDYYAVDVYLKVYINNKVRYTYDTLIYSKDGVNLSNGN